MGFEPFEGKRSHSGDPAVSITKAGNFIINSTCVERHFKGTKYIKVFWDSENEKIGIKPLTAKDTYAYRLNLSSRGNVGAFSGTAFFKSIGLEHKATKSYAVEWNKREQLIEFSVQGDVKGKKTGKD